MKLSSLGEFGLLQMLRDKLEGFAAGEGAPLLGMGDDAAAWQVGSAVMLATTDTLVQGVHFTLEQATWRELGWKALAANLSDIAAMGGVPHYALVTLALPSDAEVEGILELYDGMLELAANFGVWVVGGDLVRARAVVITITLIGEASPLGLLKRSAARPGDLVGVTGTLGASAAGLRLLHSAETLDAQSTALLRQAHLKPLPRIAEGQMLLRHSVKAAIDVSDGLVSDLAKLCQESRVGAQIMVDRVPIHPLVRTHYPAEAIPLALSGGEDYEILFSCPPESAEGILGEAQAPITFFGEIMEGPLGEVALLDEAGRVVELARGGWDHFAEV